MKYILTDVYNLFFRMKHISSRQASLDDKIGMALHTMMSSTNRVVKLLGADHIVFALDGHSWRKNFYTPYKKPRAEARQKRTEKEVEEDEVYFEMLNMFVEYLTTYTNCSVIREKDAEADDVIARFIQLHPNDHCTIVSSDSDFFQLINNNVNQYNGITKELITLEGYFNDLNKPIIDKKTKEHKKLDSPAWILFEKCMRGDKSDNVFSAYPGVRKKGTKNKTGLLEAFSDKNKKGYHWNNIMLQRWTDHNNKEHIVLDDYERNRKLIDLTLQPQKVIDNVDLQIITVLLENRKNQVPANEIGFQFMKFCGNNNLPKLAEYPTSIVNWISKPYKGILLDE